MFNGAWSKEEVGIVIETSHTYYPYQFIGLDGEVVDIPLSDREEFLKFSIVKGIDPEVRKYMNGYGRVRKKEFKSYLKAKETYEKLDNKLRDDLSSFKREVKVVSGVMSLRDFANVIRRNLSEKYDDHSVFHGAKSVHITGYTSNGITISFTQEIEKYAHPSSYPFLFEEYDMTLHVNHDCKTIDEYKKKYDKNFNIEVNTIKKVKSVNEVRESSSFAIGDKNFLIYYKDIDIEFERGFSPSKEKAEELAEVISSMI